MVNAKWLTVKGVANRISLIREKNFRDVSNYAICENYAQVSSFQMLLSTQM